MARVLAAYSDTSECGSGEVEALFESIRRDCEVAAGGAVVGDVLKCFIGRFNSCVYLCIYVCM